MILHDKPRPVRFKNFKTTAHMMSTLRGAPGTEELDAFASRIGLRPSWRQNSGTATEHYDLFDGAIERAVAAGSAQVSGRALIERVVRPRRSADAYTAAQWIQAMAHQWPTLYGHVAAENVDPPVWLEALHYEPSANYTDAQWASTVYRCASALFLLPGSGHSWLPSGLPRVVDASGPERSTSALEQPDRNLPVELDLRAMEVQDETAEMLREQRQEQPRYLVHDTSPLVQLVRPHKERRFPRRDGDFHSWMDRSFVELGITLLRAELDRERETPSNFIDYDEATELLAMLDLYVMDSTDLTYAAEEFGKTHSAERSRGLTGLLRHPMPHVREGVLLGLAGHFDDNEIRRAVQAFADDTSQVGEIQELAIELLDSHRESQIAASGSAESTDERESIRSGPAGTAGP